MTTRFLSKLSELLAEHYQGYLPPLSPNMSLLDRFLYLAACARLFLPEYRLKWPQIEWWLNKPFTAYLKRFNEHENMNTDRRWNQMQMMRLVAEVPGDTAECGCYQGAASYLICSQNRQSILPRRHHIFDSCEGLSEPSPFDGTHWVAHSLAAAEAEVYERLQPFVGEYTLYKGWIPERFAEVNNTMFCFVHIDVDLYTPTRDSIAFFYPRLSSGAVVICDDYGFTSCPGATKAIDDFLADKPEKILPLASGGGFFIKGIATSASSTEEI